MQHRITFEETPIYQAKFEVVRITPQVVYIIDTGHTGHRSVTNDVERVCEVMFLTYGNRRVIYKDTQDRWDEIVHDHGVFKQFKPVSSAK